MLKFEFTALCGTRTSLFAYLLLRHIWHFDDGLRLFVQRAKHVLQEVNFTNVHPLLDVIRGTRLDIVVLQYFRYYFITSTTATRRKWFTDRVYLQAVGLPWMLYFFIVFYLYQITYRMYLSPLCFLYILNQYSIAYLKLIFWPLDNHWTLH